MDNRRVPGLAGFAEMAAVADSNDFADSNEFKDECMKGLIVPHLGEKCQTKLLLELAACVSPPDLTPLFHLGFSTSKRVMVYPSAAPRNTSDGKWELVVTREKLIAVAMPYITQGTHLWL